MMNELFKTLGVIGLALVLAVAAYFVARDAPDVTAESEVGQMFVSIDDPLSVTGLKIVTFDDETSQTEEFEVAQVAGVWSIPSHQNYPADAQQHLVDAATSVMNLEILDAVSENKGAHEEFGVLSPSDEAASAGATGVGDRVTLSDAEGNVLADFIIGHPVTDRPQQRYVRRAGLDQVYIVKLDPSRLSTEFSDWIEEDLLKLDPFDVRRVTLADYSVQRGISLAGQPSAQVTPESEISVAFDDLENEWSLVSMKVADPAARGEEALREVELGADEQLNTARLDELKTALDDLEIVDVERKPEGLKGSTLEEFLTKNPQAFESLFRRGFSVRYNAEREQLEVLADEGDVTVGMRDGVEYVLRFGTIAGGEQKEQTPTEEGDEGSTTSDVLRYLWVVARVNESLIPEPELLATPLEPATETPAESEEASPVEETPIEEAPVEEGSPEQSPAEEAVEQPADDQPQTPAEDATDPTQPSEEAAPPSQPQGASPRFSESPTEVTQEATPAEETVPADAGPAADDGEPAAGDSQPVDDDVVDIPPAEEPPAMTRAEVEAENTRRREEHAKQVAAAQARVDELNGRFADWYFVISNEVYEKIHLGRDEVIEPKPVEEGDAEEETPAPAAPGSLEEFNQLREQID